MCVCAHIFNHEKPNSKFEKSDVVPLSQCENKKNRFSLCYCSQIKLVRLQCFHLFFYHFFSFSYRNSGIFCDQIWILFFLFGEIMPHIFDRIKRSLKWNPTLASESMLPPTRDQPYTSNGCCCCVVFLILFVQRLFNLRNSVYGEQVNFGERHCFSTFFLPLKPHKN